MYDSQNNIAYGGIKDYHFLIYLITNLNSIYSIKEK